MIKLIHRFRPLYIPIANKYGSLYSFIMKLRSILFPYVYNSHKYSNTYLQFDSQIKGNNLKNAKKIIYCFWTGDNHMTENRIKNFEHFKSVAGVEVKLITKENLSAYILKEYPLHPGYEYLSAIHKSDYLRCYFMHHHGGGYADIKKFNYSWEKLFDQLNNSDNYILGYPEIGIKGVAFDLPVINKDLKIHWKSLIGLCAFISKPQTPFTDEWYKELLKRMDSYYDDLIKNPGNIFGSNKGYPVPWAKLLGCIFHPLCLKYHNKIIQNKRLKHSLSTPYR